HLLALFDWRDELNRAEIFATFPLAVVFLLAAAPLFLLFTIGKETTESPLLFASVAVALTFCVALPPQLAFVALIVLWIRAWRRDAGLGAKILVAFLTLPYLAAATVRLWAPSALEIFRNLNAS
ncbi:MAG: hypothetical protein IJE77_02680, partial [Thermoguttaceae bacterium]|nr:hypothetical protein [Thermoguttaceae bacterium]